MEYQWLIDRVDSVIVNRSKTVVLVFLLVTVLFLGGLGSITTESGQEQFIEDLPSFQAVEDINEDFSATFTEVTTSTTLVQESENVLSKAALTDMLKTRQRIVNTNSLRVDEVSTPAITVAETLAPSATTPDAQLRAVERATPTQIDAAVREAAVDDDGFTSSLSDDFNRQSASATSSRGSVSHLAGPGEGSGGGPGGGSEYPPNKVDRIKSVVTDDASNIWVQGTPPSTTGTTTSVVLPAALLLIILFLAVAYRDPVDIAIGLLAIVMTLLWTFGFIGYAGIPFAVLLLFLLGAGIYRVTIAPIIEAPQENQLIVTFGVLLILVSTVEIVFGSDPQSLDLNLGSFDVAGVFIPEGQLYALIIALVALVGTFLFLQRTMLGRAIRGTADNRDGAQYVGINVPRIDALTFGIGAALAGLAGAVVPLFQSFTPFLGDRYLINAFVVVVLGGLGSFPGAFLGGLVVGFLQVFGSFYLSGSFYQVVIFLVFILVLLVKPEGLLGGSADE